MTRLSHVTFDLLAYSNEAMSRIGSQGVEALGKGIELQCHSDQILKQRVVNLTAETQPLGEDGSEFPMNHANPQLPHADGA